MLIPLPADKDTELQVTCVAGTIQLGGDKVTCDKGDEFTYNTKPNCRQIGSNTTQTFKLHSNRRNIRMSQVVTHSSKNNKLFTSNFWRKPG